MAYSYTLSDGASGSFGNVLDIINDTSVELGLGEVSDAYGSTDPNVIQLRGLLKRVGRQLALGHQWLELQKAHSFTTETGVSEYALPADFSRMVDQTGWNRTSDRRMVPLNAQAWQYLQATTSGTAYTALFRPRSTTLELWPQPPAAGETIAFEYQSRYWVQSSGASAGDKDAPDANTDTALFDFSLLVVALRLAFQRTKGFDSTAAQQEYRDLLSAARSASVNAAPALSLNGPRPMRLLDVGNLPDTGYGG